MIKKDKEHFLFSKDSGQLGTGPGSVVLNSGRGNFSVYFGKIWKLRISMKFKSISTNPCRYIIVRPDIIISPEDLLRNIPDINL